MYLSSTNPKPCYNETVGLICHYPDVFKVVNGQTRYSVNTPSWRKDSERLYSNEDVFSVNMTARQLKVRIDPGIFPGDPVTYTCYLPLTGGGEDNASTIVDPQGKCM